MNVLVVFALRVTIVSFALLFAQRGGLWLVVAACFLVLLTERPRA
jgi:hypothetical protein